MKRPESLSFLEKIYIIEIGKGVIFTFGKLIKNLSVHILKSLGFAKDLASDVTISYPNERRVYPKRYRGRHRLTLNEVGDVKCTSCFLCATACPAKCIYIEPAEHPDKQVEKFPLRYEIDTLLCIYCGYCVEACPVDAIRMDTGLHPEIYPTDPRSFIEDKAVLMQRSRDLETFGKDEIYRRHMQRMQKLEN